MADNAVSANEPPVASSESNQNAASANNDQGAESSNPTTSLPLGLQSYEPSAFGHTKNSDDVSFENFKISVKFPLFSGYTDAWLGHYNRLFLSFTGVFDFYIGTRPSGPVVGKEFNPQLFFQHQIACGVEKFLAKREFADSLSAPARSADRQCYFTFGYNHDSNGQVIDTLSQYLSAQNAQGTEAANDQISRGWDYLGIIGRYATSTANYRLSLYPSFKFFLSDGLLQGEPEELHYWEHPSDGKPRKEVDGLGLLAKFQFHTYGAGFLSNIGDGKLAVRYGTGYQDPFRYSTVRIEAGLQVFELPFVLWTQKGYMTDLSQYYRNVTGYGLEIEIGAF